jgi:hypothetical protein
MKYSCNSCNDKAGPCIIDIGVDQEPPCSCIYAYDGTEVEADWNAKSKEECKFSHDDFNVFLQAWLVRIKSILGQKAGEYAQDGDRLFNFRLAAKINGHTMPQALWGMATKHLVSVMDLVEGRLQPTPEIVEEKCTDLVNYIILLSAVLYDENKK